MAAFNRIYQLVVEAVAQFFGPARTTSTPIEYIDEPVDPHTRTSHHVIEYVVEETPEARSSHHVIEVLQGVRRTNVNYVDTAAATNFVC